jgi:hypothetical protein
MNFGMMVQDKETDSVQKWRTKVLDNMIKTYNSKNCIKNGSNSKCGVVVKENVLYVIAVVLSMGYEKRNLK